MVAHKVPYVATACPSYPLDLINKVKKAKAVKGPSYIHVFSMCPTGWRCASEITIKMGRLAVETGIFPLYEVENGKYRLTMEVPEKLRPVEGLPGAPGTVPSPGPLGHREDPGVCPA